MPGAAFTEKEKERIKQCLVLRNVPKNYVLVDWGQTAKMVWRWDGMAVGCVSLTAGCALQKPLAIPACLPAASRQENHKPEYLSDARSITVGFLGVLFPLSGVEEPPPLAPLRSGTFALAKEKTTCLSKHDTY